MKKRNLLLIFLTIFFLLLVSGFIVLNFSFPKSAKLWQKAPASPTPPALQAVELKETFTLPVDKEFLATIPVSTASSTQLNFFLPPKTTVRAIASGKVRYVGRKLNEAGDAQFEDLIIEDQAVKSSVDYLLAPDSRILVKTGDYVMSGEKIAQISQENRGIKCLGQAKLSITIMLEGQPAILTKEMFK
ncbi:MAG: M23 family metallopeptidase [Patescibacteria group bacterium]|nr:M23 family metallopeptidase [Patescibacteria group bacterium]MCL5095826.1 M23 family metallopeptidase [Patescibacteria group bacterium]